MKCVGQFMLLLGLMIAEAVGAVEWGGASDRIEVASFDFSDFEENLQDLSLLGDAKFVRIEGQVDGMAVQISGTRMNTVGRLLYSIPVNLLDAFSRPASFSTFFEFAMTSFAGDGLAFVIVPDKVSIGASGPWLGLMKQDEIFNKHTFAVEFDSVMNMELRDPNSNHVGLDVETIVSTVTANASDISVVLNDGSRTYAWIDYDGLSRNLQVRISKSSEFKPLKPLLSHKIDLAAVWKPWMFVGFSSSTGTASQKHKIFSWRFFSGPSEASHSIVQQLHSIPADPQVQELQNEQHHQLLHSFPADPSGFSAPRKSEDREVAPGAAPGSGDYRFDTGFFISLLVGFTCGASVTMFLVAGWVLIAKRNNNSEGRGDYEEIK